MKKISMFLIAVGLTFGLTGMALAQTATQQVSFQIAAVNTISVSGPPPVLVISTIPGTATDNSTTYSVTTNQANRRITGQIDAAMPASTELLANLQAPAGATSAGAVALSTTAVSLVTGITRLVATGRSITYTFNAIAGASDIASDSRTVTFTITNP